jgi:hypothetical protein
MSNLIKLVEKKSLFLNRFDYLVLKTFTNRL